MGGKALPAAITRKDTFSRREYADAMADKYRMTAPQISYDLQKRLHSGEIIRKGWGQYVLAADKQRYQYSYSGLTKEIAELFQLNDFMNHQLAHNTVFVLAEHDFVEAVFDSLFSLYRTLSCTA